MSSEGVKRFGTSAEIVRQKVYVKMKLTVSYNCDSKSTSRIDGRVPREGCILQYLDRSLNTDTPLYFVFSSFMPQRCAAKVVSSECTNEIGQLTCCQAATAAATSSSQQVQIHLLLRCLSSRTTCKIHCRQAMVQPRRNGQHRHPHHCPTTSIVYHKSRSR